MSDTNRVVPPRRPCPNHPDRPGVTAMVDGTWKCEECSPAGFRLPGGESTSAALRRAEAEIAGLVAISEELTAALRNCVKERDEARRQRNEFMAAADKLNDSWLELKTELASARDSIDARDRALIRARAQIGELIAQATSRHGTTLCPRCGVALAAEVDAENGENR